LGRVHQDLLKVRPDKLGEARSKLISSQFHNDFGKRELDTHKDHDALLTLKWFYLKIK
jgi:hypothetical protein